VICFSSNAHEREVEYVALDKLSCFEMCLIKDNCTMVSYNKKNQSDCLLLFKSTNDYLNGVSQQREYDTARFDNYYTFF
jgi:hypothetical protein